MAEKAIIIHSLADARMALAAAREVGEPLTLLSAEGAAGFAGALWFREVVAAARAEYPEVAVTAILDCGDKPGHLLAALRCGLKSLCFTGRRRARERLAAIAEAYGAEILAGRVEALDLFGQKDPASACRAWLRPAA